MVLHSRKRIPDRKCDLPISSCSSRTTSKSVKFELGMRKLYFIYVGFLVRLRDSWITERRGLNAWSNVERSPQPCFGETLWLRDVCFAPFGRDNWTLQSWIGTEEFIEVKKMYSQTHWHGCISSGVRFVHATYLCLVLWGFLFWWVWGFFTGPVFNNACSPPVLAKSWN